MNNRLRLFCPDELLPRDGSAARLAAWAGQPGVAVVVGLPDLHWKRRNAAPTGAALASRDFLFSGFLDAGLGCGMLLVALEASQARRNDGEWRELEQRLRDALIAPGHPAERATLVEILEADADAGSSPSARGKGKREDGELRRLLPERYLERARADFGTVGGGNHFVELLEVDAVHDGRAAAAAALELESQLLLIHSGSGRLGRAMGRLYALPGRSLRHARDLGYHLARHAALLFQAGREFARLPAESAAGRHFLRVARAMQRLGAANRAEIARRAMRVLGNEGQPRWASDHPHNFVAREEVGGEVCFVHRHGAAARAGFGLLPLAGGPGQASYLVAPCVHPEALDCLPHGAGRDGAGDFKSITAVVEALRREGLAHPVARCRARTAVKFR